MKLKILCWTAMALIAGVIGGPALAGTDTTKDTSAELRAEQAQLDAAIRETQALIDELLLRFTDSHPDVIAARRMLELLNRRAVELAGPQGQKETTECQQNGDDPNRRKYHALANRLQRVNWSNDPCFRPYILKLSAP